MNEKTLENRYRVLLAGFTDSDRGRVFKERLGSGYQGMIETLVLGFGHDLALMPKHLDQQHISQLLSELIPGRLPDSAPNAGDVPDLVEEILLYMSEAEGLALDWEWTRGVEGARSDFAAAMANSDRPRFAAPKAEPHRRPADKIGRNDPCPCGSGKKYKKCCARL